MLTYIKRATCFVPLRIFLFDKGRKPLYYCFIRECNSSILPFKIYCGTVHILASSTLILHIFENIRICKLICKLDEFNYNHKILTSCNTTR